MKRLYEKNELGFALLWIGIYVVAFSLADGASSALGTEKILTAPLSILLAGFLLYWIRKNGLTGKYGLGQVTVDGKAYLYFLPLGLLVSANLWGGVTLRFGIPETVLYVVNMLGVGILEEVIFRGFLFKALCKENIKRAVVISSLTFGIGHIVNLLNGAEVFATLLQICYATAAGFLFTILFHRSGSLLPCIITHSAVNGLSAFCKEQGAAMDVISAVALTVISLAYAWWIIGKTAAPAGDRMKG